MRRYRGKSLIDRMLGSVETPEGEQSLLETKTRVEGYIEEYSKSLENLTVTAVEADRISQEIEERIDDPRICVMPYSEYTKIWVSLSFIIEGTYLGTELCYLGERYEDTDADEVLEEILEG